MQAAAEQRTNTRREGHRDEETRATMTARCVTVDSGEQSSRGSQHASVAWARRTAGRQEVTTRNEVTGRGGGRAAQPTRATENIMSKGDVGLCEVAGGVTL
jgi:hypothetical protein